ncbi:MAG: trigger factor [Treponema sp.]|nr:trigger factor [Treponema sp.]MBR6193647.1 trigger factor [Treponema sp.]
MNVTKEIQKIENSALKLTATIAQADVESGYKSEFAKYAKNIQIPGFRKGHVPTKIIEQKYGEAIKQEITGGLIDEALNEILQADDAKDIRPLPYSQPRLDGDKLPELDTTKDFTFTVVYDIFPTVEVKNFSGIAIKEPQVEIGEKEIEDELKSIQERNAVVIDKKEGETVEKDNIVTIDYKELNDDGSTVDGSTREGFVFTVGSGENIYKIDDEIIGMKKDESKEITKAYAADDKDPELAGKTKKISVTVKAIKVRDLPKIDDDLAQDVSEKYKTLADLKDDLKKQMESAKTRKIAELKSQSLLEQLVEKNPIDLPKSMIQTEQDARWRMLAQQFQTTPEQLEKMILSSGQSKSDMITQWTGDTEKMLKSRLIVDALLREKNISVTPEEVESQYQKIADAQGVSVDEIKKHYEDPRNKEYLVDETKENKLFEELYKDVKVSKGEKTSFADLFKPRQ